MTVRSTTGQLLPRPVVLLGVLGLAVGITLLGLLQAGTVTQASHSTFTVNSTGDAADASAGDGTCETATAGECSLRAAIEEANAHAGADTIAFGIPGVGPHTIMPASALPSITESVTIDGYTQPGSSVNTSPAGSGTNAVLQIVVDGSGTVFDTSGLVISSAGPTRIRGLVINGFPAGGDGIEIAAGSGHLIDGNFIGTNAAGNADLGIGNDAIRIHGGTGGNTIGGTTPEAVNLISGNGTGPFLDGSSIDNNVVQGNYIGTDATGTLPLGNDSHGVGSFAGSGNIIGGTAPGAANLIAFNVTGVSVEGGDQNSIRGNSIYSNTGKGIDLFTPSTNGGIAAPTVTAAGSASGTSACLSCTVDVYSDSFDEGEVYHGSTTTDGGTGNWSFTGVVTGPNITATVTDGSGNTSEFSVPLLCTTCPPPSAPTPIPPGPPLAVGGVAGVPEADDDDVPATSSESRTAAAYIAALAGVIGATLIAGGWYVRRRWLR